MSIENLDLTKYFKPASVTPDFLHQFRSGMSSFVIATRLEENFGCNNPQLSSYQKKKCPVIRDIKDRAKQRIIENINNENQLRSVNNALREYLGNDFISIRRLDKDNGNY